MVRAHAQEVAIVAVGPLTTLALALRNDPEIAGLVRRLVIMAGAFGYHGHLGNVTPAAEANILSDPHAADETLVAAGQSPWWDSMSPTDADDYRISQNARRGGR